MAALPQEVVGVEEDEEEDEDEDVEGEVLRSWPYPQRNPARNQGPSY